MNSHEKMLIILLSSPLLILVIHMILSRILKKPSPQMVAVTSIVAGYVPMAIILNAEVLGRDGLAFGTGTAVSYCFIVYSSIAYTYFHFFNMGETARRIRILFEISRAGSLHEGEIAELYKTTDIVNLRIQRLVGLRQLKYDDGYYSVNGKTLYMAALLVSFWRTLLGFDRRG